jgi:hypothetical protein
MAMKPREHARRITAFAATLVANVLLGARPAHATRGADDPWFLLPIFFLFYVAGPAFLAYLVYTVCRAAERQVGICGSYWSTLLWVYLGLVVGFGTGLVLGEVLPDDGWFSAIGGVLWLAGVIFAGVYGYRRSRRAEAQ